jgi:hypothetical protein
VATRYVELVAMSEGGEEESQCFVGIDHCDLFISRSQSGHFAATENLYL